MLFDLVMLAFREDLLVFALAALPVLCAFLSYAALRSERPKGQDWNSDFTATREAMKPASFRLALQRYRAFFVFIVAFSFMHGYLQYFSALSSSWIVSGSMSLLVARCIAMGMIFLLLSTKFIRIDIVLRAGIVVALLGFTLISDSFFLSATRGAGVFAAAAGYACFDVIAWSLLSEMAFYNSKQGTRIIAFGIFVWQAGTFLGAFTGIASDVIGVSDAMAGIMISTIALCLVGVGVYFLGSEFWLAVRYGSSFAQTNTGVSDGSVLDMIAARHMLTKREKTILSYLVKGRSVPYIAEAECISENTVRSHAKNIYAKLDVHTKQELINVVETGDRPTRIV